MSGGNVQIKVDAQLDPQQLDQQLDQIRSKVNALGQSIAAANKVKFEPLGRQTAQDIDRMARRFAELKRSVPNFSAALNRSGQSGADFLNVDWGKAFGSAITREAMRLGTFQRVTGVSFAQESAPASPNPSQQPSASPSPSGGGAGSAGGGGRGGRGGGFHPASPGGSFSWRGFGARALGGVMRAGGGAAGGAVADAMGYATGAAGASLTGVGLIAGGVMAAKAAEALAGAVKAKIADAQQEDIAVDTLKRTLGDVNVSFDALKSGMRSASASIGVLYNEGVKLGSEFAHLGNVTEKGADQIAQEVQFGGGFARSFGLDPSQTVAFMGQMRVLRQTNDVQDSQRLGLIIGETIARSGAFAQADRVFAAIGSFAQQQVRLGLTPANIAGYGGMLSAMAGSGVPGLDVNGSADILGRVNASIQSGGSGAWRNFMYRAVGTRLGLDPVQTNLLRETGAFGTGAAEFGPGSTYARWAAANGMKVPGTATGSTQTLMSMVMGGLRGEYHGSQYMNMMRVEAMSENFGISRNQAMALDLAYGKNGPAAVDTTLKRLQRLGIDISKVNATGISNLVQNGGTMTDEQFKAAVSQAQEKTPGSEIRDSLTALQNTLQDYASKMLPLTQTAADALLFLAGRKNGTAMSAEDVHNAVMAGERKTVNDRADARIAKARSAFNAANGVDEFGRQIDPAGAKAAFDNLDAETKAAEADRAAGLAKVNSSGLKISPSLAKNAGDWAVNAAAAAQDKYGVPAAVTLAQYALESGYGKSGLAKRSNNPFGIQYRGKDGVEGVDFVYGDDQHADGTHYRARFRKYKSLTEAFEDHAKLLATDKRYAAARGHTDDPASYVDAIAPIYAEDPKYAPKLKAIMGDMYSMPTPDGAKVPSTQHNVDVNVTGDFNMVHPNGSRQPASNVSIQTTASKPVAAGSN
ncbi:glycoside hydrolase family 73 protein [Burkholderia ambifaria]|uniref:glycoside hydrolase family 73 protein n=1 Tax=Burkholderia ambifaria TaxID=152480 RepID=UPI00158935F6|nr:glucosaminidase domain-containing protein [Burkholderia ambifaria]